MVMKSELIQSSLLALLSAPVLGAAMPVEGGSASAAQVVATQVTPLEVLSRATDAGPASGERALTVAVSMPFARPAEAQAFVDDVSNPHSPNYRHFITPDEVGARFGIEQDQVNRIADYMRQNGFQVTLVSPTRLSVIANGTVAQAEQAFHTTIRAYTITPANEYEPSEFIAPSTTLRMPADIAPSILDVSGLDTYTRPRPLTTLTPILARELYNTQPMFAGGMQGQGRVTCVSNFDGFRLSNIPLYVSHFSLPVPPGGAGSNIVVVPCSGGGAGAGTPGAEGDLDIQQQLGMAPLATIRVYDSPPGGNLIAVLSQENFDNQCDQVSESYGWQLTSSGINSAHNQHVAMSAEGITYMAASGDSGTSLDPFSYPDLEPEVLSVGGTVATVNTTTGARISEVGWGSGGGGWSTNASAVNVRPPWQVGNGVPAINGSNNHRLVPDVAFHSSSGSGAYQFYFNNALTGGFVGTSFAAPLFSGDLCIIEQQAIALGGLPADIHGHRRFGRIQDYIYSQNGNPTIWFDILSGNNGSLPAGQGASTAHAGWDTVCGWGPMNCQAFAMQAACDTGGCGGGGPGTPFCFGDGQDPLVTTACPCLNFGTTGHGCANAVNSNGALLTLTGTTTPDTIVLTSAGELNSSLSVFLQGNVNTNSGILFGDGVRCAAGSLKRLYTLNASGGTVAAPGPTDPPISVQSAALGDTILPGTSRYYQVYYRDPNLSFCTGLGFNVSNGMRIDW
jgi:subtilase family serine protease